MAVPALLLPFILIHHDDRGRFKLQAARAN